METACFSARDFIVIVANFKHPLSLAVQTCINIHIKINGGCVSLFFEARVLFVNFIGVDTI